MLRPRRRRHKRLSAVEEEEEQPEPATPGPNTLRLGIVHRGPYVPWVTSEPDEYSSYRCGQKPLWVIETNTSRMMLNRDSPSDKDDDEEEEEEYVDSTEESETFGNVSGEQKAVSDLQSECQTLDDPDDDPNLFIMKMKKDLDIQSQMLRILMLAHMKARMEWAQTPFKLTGLEGRGEAEVLKLLFLVADQPLEDERITADQVEEQKGQTPYGEFPMISKCGRSFGDASAISLALATKFQLFGETVQEQLVVGATYFRLRRVQVKHKRTLTWVFCGQVKDKTKIEWAQGQILHVILPPLIKEWDQQICSTKGPFLVESGMTLGDIAIMDFLDQCSSHVMIDSLLVDYLAVADMTEAVKSCPRLLAHLQDREED